MSGLKPDTCEDEVAQNLTSMIRMLFPLPSYMRRRTLQHTRSFPKARTSPSNIQPIQFKYKTTNVKKM